ncbi:MAG TPA: hypothetical protein VNQ73_05705 [Ilumatobacter sp.]|nr:hypothetical protein [Ilumatobacter sp.]
MGRRERAHSGEGSYPAFEREKAIFQRRGIPYLSQTAVQRYLVNELLGFDGTFAYHAGAGCADDES